MASQSNEKRFSSVGEDSKQPSTCSTPSTVSTVPNCRLSHEAEQQEQSSSTETDWKSLSQILVSFFLTFNTWYTILILIHARA
jgi:hypothetical protein